MRGVNSCPVRWTRAKACLSVHGLGPCRIHDDHVVGAGEVKPLGGDPEGRDQDARVAGARRGLLVPQFGY